MSVASRPVASLPALGPWAPPAERNPSLESIYRVSLTVDLCEGNKIISFKKLFHHSQLGPLKKKKTGGPGHALSMPIDKDGHEVGPAARRLHCSKANENLKVRFGDNRRIMSEYDWLYECNFGSRQNVTSDEADWTSCGRAVTSGK